MPNIIIDVAGESAGIPGEAREFVFSKVSPTPPLVSLSIDDNTGITTWAWEILAQPVGANAVLGTPTASTAAFTPDASIPGTYLIRVTLNGTTVLTNAVAWRSQHGDYRYPAPGETIEFDSGRGWDPAVQAIFESIEYGIAAGRQRSVIDYVDGTSVPPTEVVGDRYILDDTGAPHVNWDGSSQLDIVEFTGSVWVAQTPEEGRTVHVDTGDKEGLYIDDGTPMWKFRPSSGEFVTDYAASDTLNDITLEGIHRSTSAITECVLTLPKITTAMIGQRATFDRWGVASMAVKPASGDTLADGATSLIVARNSMTHEVKVASLVLEAVSITEWAINSMVGSWPTEAL